MQLDESLVKKLHSLQPLFSPGFNYTDSHDTIYSAAYIKTPTYGHQIKSWNGFFITKKKKKARRERGTILPRFDWIFANEAVGMFRLNEKRAFFLLLFTNLPGTC